jgi:hypothetical protein
MKKKKARKKKLKKRTQTAKNDISKKLFNDIVSERMNKAINSYHSSQSQTMLILKEYSVRDIFLSLFISNLWLPNISSQVKHQFLYSLILSLDSNEFRTSNRINRYSEFVNLLKKLHEYLPTFPSIEDYVPEPDWGEIKYENNGKIYSIFYGNELSNVYEYMALFEIIFGAYDKEFNNLIHRSPLNEFEICLRLQHLFINGIPDQKIIEKLDFYPGHIEIPSEAFFLAAKNIFLNLNISEIVPPDILKYYSKDIEKITKDAPNFNKFGDCILSGQLLPWYFLIHQGKFYPVLPRRYFSILFDSWCREFSKIKNSIINSSDPLDTTIGSKIYGYIKKRIKTESLFPIVSAIAAEGKPHTFIFNCAFISKNRIILIHQLALASSGNQIEQNLKADLNPLKDAIALVSKQPVTLALHLSRENVQFQSKYGEKLLEPYPVTLIPQVSTQIRGIEIPKDFPGHVMFLDGFLGIIDELDDIDDFSEFIDYLRATKGYFGGFSSILDQFGSFKDSKGVLIEGALSPDMISLDPHWGTGLRYRSLLEFWKLFPTTGYFDDPRSWKVAEDGPNRVRLESRSFFGFAVYTEKLSKHFFLTAPFKDMNYDQGRISNLLIECLEDSLERRKEIISSHIFFQHSEYCRIDILFFPFSLISENEKYKHLSHLKLKKQFWASDYFLPETNHLGIRIVFDDLLLREFFEKTNDCSIESGIVVELFKSIDRFYPDDSSNTLLEKLEKTCTGAPRFKMFAIQKPVSFPEFINVNKPKDVHFKRVRKRIAEITKAIQIDEGDYGLEDAKEKINSLNKLLVSEISEEIKSFDFLVSIPFLLSRIDALVHDNFRKQSTIEFGLTHDIDYNPNRKFANQHSEFIRTHRNYRYLIEKFVQIRPAGQRTLEKDDFQYLIAFVDWILTFYSASDSLHYGIHPIGIKVHNDFLIDIEMDKDDEDKERVYGEEKAKIDLGLIGKSDDKVQSDISTENILKELDSAFLKDYQFQFSILINVTQIMANWPNYSGDKESSYYKANIEKIQSACTANIEGINPKEIPHILDFFTLKQESILFIGGSDTPCYDLPVWEHRKRVSRYMIKPVIRIDDKYYWAPYSIRQAGIIWASRPADGTLPADIFGNTINQVIDKQKASIERNLENKAFDIVKRKTGYVRKNLWLHKADKEGKHPLYLGDYDVLSYINKKKTIIIIECKDILPVYCMKDGKRLREKIFGRPGKEKGYIDQVAKRHNYFEENQNRILEALSWPFNSTEKLSVISIFVSRHDYWWTRFPPIETKTLFTRIDLLSHVISRIL